MECPGYTDTSELCLLKHKGLGFELRYYHRYIDSNRDAQFGEKAAKVFESVVLEDN